LFIGSAGNGLIEHLGVLEARREDMTYNEVIETIGSSTGDDWIHDDKKKRWTLKSDVMIHFADTTDEELGEDVQDRVFDEEWATKHSDPKARRVVYTIYYGASFLRMVDLVAVDGYRAMLPMPEAHDALVVDPWQYHFARIVNGAAVDEYMGRAGLTVRG